MKNLVAVLITASTRTFAFPEYPLAYYSGQAAGPPLHEPLCSAVPTPDRAPATLFTVLGRTLSHFMCD